MGTEDKFQRDNTGEEIPFFKGILIKKERLVKEGRLRGDFGINTLLEEESTQINKTFSFIKIVSVFLE